MNDGVISAAAGVLLVGVFAIALRHKLSEPRRFAASLDAYRLLPEALAFPAAVGLIVLEAVAILAILVWFGLGTLVAGGLLLLYFLAMAVNLLRGHRTMDCGCGDEPTRLSWLLLLRNGLLIAAAWTAASLGTPAGFVEWVAGAALGGVGIVLYLAFEQLFANLSFRQRVWGGA